MKNIARIVMMGLLLAIGANSAWSATDRLVQQKIGYVDILEVQLKAAPVKALFDQAEKRVEPKMKDAESLINRRDALAKQTSVKDAKQAAEARQQLADINDKLTLLEGQINRQMDQETNSTASKATDIIMRAVTAVAAGQGYTMVLKKQDLLYGIPSVDLTPAVVQYINGGGGNASAAPAQAPAQPAAKSDPTGIYRK